MGLAERLMKYGRPFWAAIGEGNAADVAGAANVAASYLFGPDNVSAEEAFYQGRRDYKRDLHDARWESPFAAFAAEALGTAAFGALGARGAVKGGGTLIDIFNRFGSAAGARALRQALERGYFPKDITAGRMSRQRLQEINQIRRGQGFEELTDRRVIWPRAAQRHIYERRVLGNRVSPRKVSEWQRQVFFRPESRAYPTKNYPGVTEMRAPSGKKVIRGFLTKDENGRTIGTSVYREKGKKYRIEP